MSDLSPRAAARIAGAGLLAMAAIAILGTVGTQSPIVTGDAARTASNIMDGELLFRLGVGGWLVIACLDVAVALALYVVFRHVNQSLSMVAAWFRLVYAAVFTASISGLALAVQLQSDAAYTSLGRAQLNAYTMLALNAFKTGWALGLVAFGVSLGVLGYLAYVSGYIPRLLGILLWVAAFGYVFANLGKLVLPSLGSTMDAIAAGPAAIAEIALAGWLLARAARLPEIDGG